MLKIGDPAPKFEFEDQSGKKANFPDAFKGKWTGLIFLRTLACPLCMEKINELNKSGRKYQEQGVELLVVVQSTANRVKEYSARKQIQLRLIGDLERKIYSLYGVEIGGLGAFFAPQVMSASIRATVKGHLHGMPEGNELQKPACFIVDPAGTLVYLEYGRNIADIIKEERFFQVLSGLKEGKK